MESIIILTSIAELTANVTNAELQTTILDNEEYQYYSVPVNMLQDALDEGIQSLASYIEDDPGDDTWYDYLPDLVDQIMQLFYHAKEISPLNFSLETYCSVFNDTIATLNQANPEDILTWDLDYIRFLVNHSKTI